MVRRKGGGGRKKGKKREKKIKHVVILVRNLASHFLCILLCVFKKILSAEVENNH